MATLNPKNFSNAVLKWFDQYGRKTLPWQQDKTPYRVWISEIMLQQTQVTTVIDYFNRFMQRFPTVDALAKPTEDDVLHHWFGLGYYARARNLHRTAKCIVENHHSQFPQDLAALENLPGIGRSTAGAILSLGCHRWASILDGNVKRVLTRVFGMREWAGLPIITQQLWAHAAALTPHTRFDDYNQAMMDLGATVCTRSQPHCKACPLKKYCYAYPQGLTDVIPAKKPKKILPVKKVNLLMLQNANGDVLLERRPNCGIWGGLWCFPEITDATQLPAHCKTQYGATIAAIKIWKPFRHTFTHYHLDITPIHATIRTLKKNANEHGIWYNSKITVGLATPTQQLLQTLQETP